MFYRCFFCFFVFFLFSVFSVRHKIWHNHSREWLNGFSWYFYQMTAGKMEFPSPYPNGGYRTPINFFGAKNYTVRAWCWRLANDSKKLVYAGSVLYGGCVKKAWTSECILSSIVVVVVRDENGSSFVTDHTVDLWPTWPMTHDPWSLHHFVVPMVRLRGGVHGTVVIDNPLGLESKKIVD